jgi:hypothetical protein
MLDKLMDKLMDKYFDSPPQHFEFPMIYAELDLILKMYPDDLGVHDFYADVLLDEVYSFGEDRERPDEKLRKARKHHYYVIRHSEVAKSDYLYRAIEGLAGQARVLGKKRYEIRLNQILRQVYGETSWGDSEYA